MRYTKDWIATAVEAVPGDKVPEIWKEWTALSVVGATLQRQVHYKQGAYLIRPNLYIVLIGAPAAGKSTSLQVLYNKIFSGLCEPIFANAEEKKKAQDVYDQYLNPKESADIEPPRYMLRGEATHAKIAQSLPQFVRPLTLIDPEDGPVNVDGCSLAVVTSEFGSFMNKNDHKLQHLLTEGWDSNETYEKGTKGQGDNMIQGMTLSWISCATPDMFVENLPRMADKQGLLSRIIPVYVPGHTQVQPLREKAPDPDKLELLRLHLGTIAIQNKGVYQISDEASAIIERWRGYSEKEIKVCEPIMQNYMSRRLAHMIKMSMCYAAARRKELIIQPEDWNSAYDLITRSEKHMPEVLRRFAMTDAGRFADDLKTFVKSCGGTTTYGKLLNLAMSNAKSIFEAKQTIDVLVENGILIRDGSLIEFGRD